MKLKLLILIVIIGGAFSPLSAQVGIGISTPDSSAMLQVFSTTRGFLPPYMSQAQRDSISTPAEGLMLYCSDCSPEGYYVYIDGAWESLRNSTLSEADVDGFVANNGYLSSEVDGSTTNEIQTISRSGLTLTLSNGGGTVQDSVLDEAAVDSYVANNGYLTQDTTLTEAEVDAFVANNGYLTSFTEVDGSTTNEIQDLSIANDTLTLSGDATTVDLKPYLDNTDNQGISRSGLTVTLENGGTFQDSVLDETAVDNYVANNGYLSSEVDGSVTNEIQDLSVANDTLTLSGDATTVDLKPYLDNTDNQGISRSGLTVTLENGGTFQDSVLDETAVDNYVANNGYLTSEVDGSTTNEIQTISRSGLTLTLSNGGGTVQDSILDEAAVDNYVANNGYLTQDTTLTEAEVDAFVANNGYLTSFTEVDGSVTNEIQDLSIANDTLTLSGDATTVDLKPYLDNTDNQAISRSGLTVTLENGGTFQDSVLDETAVDNYVANNGYLSSEVDGSVTNEIQDLSLSNNTLSLTGDGTTVDLGGYLDNTDDQAISRSGLTVTLENGGSFQDSVLNETAVDNYVANNGYLTSEVDGSTTNEIQTISRSGLTLTLSNGGGTVQDSVLDEAAVDSYVANNGYLTQDTTLTEAEVDAFVANNGYLTSFTEVDGSTTNEIQDLSLSNNTLSLTGDGTTVDLGGYLDNTDNQAISRSGLTVTLENGGTFQDSVLDETAVDSYVANNGYLTSEVDGSTTNEIQTISRSGLTLTLSNGGGTVQDSVLDETAVDSYVANNGYLTSFTEVDGSTTNEIQDLSLSNNTLSLSGDATTVDLGGYLDNTDAQDLSLTGNTLSLTNDASTVDLSAYLDNTNLSESQVDSYVSNNGYLTFEMDGSTSNELQTISKSGSTVTLSNSGGSFTDDVLTEAQVDAYANNNGYLTSFTEIDGSTTNEIQDLSLSGNTLSLTGDGTTVDLGGYLDNTNLTEAQVDAYVANNGYLTSASLPISTDTTLAGESDSEAPSENAVKAYVDNAHKLALHSLGTENFHVNLNNMSSGMTDEANYNMALGYNVMLQLDSGDYNNGIGYRALDDLKTGSRNDAMGYFAMHRLQSGSYNTGIGFAALEHNVSGSSNVALGNKAGQAILGSGNVMVGVSAGGTTTGDDNTFVGHGAGLYSQSTGSVFIGHDAGSSEDTPNSLYIDNGVSTTTPLIVGNFADNRAGINTTRTALNTGATLQIGGDISLQSGTNVNELSTDGTFSGNSDDAVPTEKAVKTYVDNAVSGATSGGSGLQLSASGTESYYAHSSSFNTVTANGYNTALGYNVMNSVHGSWSIGIGHSAMADISGSGMVHAIAIGNNSMENVVSATYSIGIGSNTLDAVNSASSNIAIGYNSMTNVSSGGYNVGVGVYTLDALTTGDRNTAIGHQSGGALTTGQWNTYIGSAAGLYNNGSKNTFIGRQAGNNATTADGGVFIGYTAGYNETGDDMLYIENSSGATPLIGGSFSGDRVGINVAASTVKAGGATLQVGGDLSLLSGTSANEISTDGSLGGNSDDAIPTEKAVKSYVDASKGLILEGIGIRNTHGGNLNMDAIQSTAYDNSGFGYGAFEDLTNGDFNTATGVYALANITTASYNTAMGRSALGNLTTTSSNVAIGSYAGLNASGGSNIFIGRNAGYNNTGGKHNNVMIGRNAGYNSQASDCVFIGYQAGYSEDGDDRLYIENSSGSVPLIGGDFTSNVVTVNTSTNNLSYYSGLGINFVVSGDAFKTAAGSWWGSSDRRLKTNINYLSSESTLQKVLRMKGVSYEWNDTTTGLERPDGIQYGFIAQELQEVWPTKVKQGPEEDGYLMAAYGDFDAMFVESFRALYNRITELEAQNAKLQAKINTQEDEKADLQSQIDDMGSDISELKAMMKEIAGGELSTKK